MRVGVDLVAVARMDPGADGERRLASFFTPGELIWCRSQAEPAQCLAARWAAKEALFKALGTGCLSTAWWLQVEVVSDGAGAPHLRLSGEVAERTAALGAQEIHVSISHLPEMAVAVVILAP